MSDVETHEFDDTKIWFRDALYQVLSWGTATFVLIAGWLIGTGDEVLSFKACSTTGFTDKACSGAVITALVVAIMVPFWIWLLNKLWVKVGSHDTRLPRRAMNLYAATIAIVGLVVLCSALFDGPEKERPTSGDTSKSSRTQ